MKKTRYEKLKHHNIPLKQYFRKQVT